MKKVAINGFGRIGRLIYRQIHCLDDVEVVAINDLSDPKQLAILLEHDSAQGRFLKDEISYDKDNLIVCNKKIKILSQRNPRDLPWNDLDIDLVIESTGLFLTMDKAKLHIEAGAKKVLLSAPSSDKEIKTVVYGVNHNILKSSDYIVSAASCTTNCLAVLINALHQSFKVKHGWMTTVHSCTNDQRLLDLVHPKDVRRGRSALLNIIPTTTGAAKTVGKVIPELNGKLDGYALRVPTPTGSIVDLVVEFEKKTSVKEVNDTLLAYAKNHSKEFDASYFPYVSSDIIGNTHGSIADLSLTNVMEDGEKQLFKIFSWYDNELSYVSQFVRTLKHWLSC